MTTARPTVSLIAHVDPQLKEWIRSEARTRGTSQQKLVEEILSGYMFMTEEVRRHPGESVNITAITLAGELEELIREWEFADISEAGEQLVEKINNLIDTLRERP